MGDAATFSLGTVSSLLGDQARVFSDVYKLYGFKDGDTFSDYVNFFLHEPVAWFEGLPASLKSKVSFAKPKTAFSKALKHGDVIAALGAEACEAAISVLWNTYKKEADRIVAARSLPEATEDAAAEAAEAAADTTEPHLEIEEVEERPLRRSRKQKSKAAEIHVGGNVAALAAGESAGAKLSYETKYRIVDQALRAMLGSGQNEATLVLLNALREA
jgi:hypothetical protein